MPKKADLEKEELDKVKLKHKLKYNCSLGSKRCVNCDKVARIVLFTPRTSWCKVCQAERQIKYRQKRAETKFAETGVAARRSGRPPGAKNKIHE